MKFTFSILTICGLILFSSCESKESRISPNRFSNPELVAIYDLADNRNSQSLLPYLSNPKAENREAAALAFASIQDTAAVFILETLLNDSSENVRIAAAYSIGQIGKPSSIKSLIAASSFQQSEMVRGQILESLGKVIVANFKKPVDDSLTEIGLNFLNLIRFDTEGDHLGWAKAAFWIHLGGITDRRLMDRMPYVLQTTGSESRVACALAMVRYKEDSWFREEYNKKYILSWCHSERNSEVRAPQISMLSRINDADSKNVLLGYLKSEYQEQNVKVAALRAAGKMESIEASELVALLSDQDDYIVLECLAALETKSPEKLSDQLTGVYESQRIAQIRATALRLMAVNSLSGISEMIWSGFNENTDTYAKVHFAHALGKCPEKASLCFDAIMQSQEFPVIYALTEAFVEMHKNKNWPSDIDYVQKALLLFEKGDLGVQALIATDLREIKLTADEKKSISQKMKPALESLHLPKEIETYNEIVRTLNQISEEKIPEKSAGFNHPIDWKFVSTIPSAQQVRVTTAKGDFIIDMKVEDAPGSVANFVKLAKDGFYDNKYFHRVVPNFVIQGGCPRGDGMGGTDYTIRSEFALHNYMAGAVGLASSGKDTESCQWFVSHLSTPHLEGRYTIFGYVSQGIDVVKKIVVGDKIIKVVVL